MAVLNGTLLYTAVVFLSVFYQLTNSQISTTTTVSNSSETANTITSNNTQVSVATSTTSSSNVSISVTTTNWSNTPTTVNATISISTSTVQSTASVVDITESPDAPSRPGWWLLVALVVAIAIVVVAGVTFYYRQHSPYRRSISCLQWCRQCNYRFLQNWRSRDDDADNIILQLEQPEITNGQWPPRISFT